MEISNLKIEKGDEKAVYQVEVESIKGKQTLWYSLNDAFYDLLSENFDAALVALLIPAMANNEDIYIRGAISEKLFYNLSGPLQSILKKIIPWLQKIKIYPRDIYYEQNGRSVGVAMGFSGGIDSYCALADHYYSALTKGFKVTHLLFNNVGSHGSGGERLFRERYERLLPAVESLGIPFLMVNSNVDFFYDQKLGFEKTHTLRNASVALLLQGGIGRYMYASAYKYSDIFVGPTNYMAYSDPITLPLLSTDKLDVFSVGSEYTRVEKTLRVAELPDSYRMLDVCVNANNMNGYTNCSTCWKCLRTLATLEISGKLQHYSNSFDLKAYQKKRIIFFTTLLGNSDPLPQEIVQYANDCGYSFPVVSRALHATRVYPILRFLWRKIKILKKSK